MAWVASMVTTQVMSLLTSSQGINACAASLALAENVSVPTLQSNQIQAQNVQYDLAERSTVVVYPMVSVYCEKIVNQLKEKSRNFSGKAAVGIEIRVSQDRLDGIGNQLDLYLDAITQVLDQNRGAWGDGLYYGGGYEATLGAVKHGGQNFIQSGKVTFDVVVST